MCASVTAATRNIPAGAALPVGMTEIRGQIGRYGAWVSSRVLTPEIAPGLESAGYGALWLGGADAELTGAERALDATSTLVVSTGIVNVWQTDAASLARAYHRVAGKHGDRFVLGVGTGHREAFGRYRQPYETLAGFVDTLLEAGVPAGRIVLAALGPRVLRLGAERTAGVHPYLVPPEHTRRARAEIGPGPLLAPEHKVVLDPDPERGRALGRETVQRYLGMVNYTANLRRLGCTDEDLAGSGSDRLVDAVIAHGTAEQVAARLEEHLAAGADHVPVQVLGDDLLAGYRTLAPVLGLSARDAG
jgi:probable F420-dependent oxidoreductase